jgi:uncharacterized protein (DUF885 family)
MLRWASLLVGVLMLTPFGVDSSADQPVTEDAKLAKFFKFYLDEEAKLWPVQATRLGDHRYDSLMDDISAAARTASVERYRRELRELPKHVDYPKLSRAGQIDYEILRQHLTRSLWSMENTKPFEEDPRTYNEYIVESVYVLLTQSTLPKATNVQNCVARMAQIPRIVDTAKKTLKNPPQVFVETAIRQNRGAISFYESDIFLLSGETPQVSELGRVAKTVIECLKAYQMFLEKELLPRATGDWRLGKERFAKKFDLEMDAGITAEEVIKDAEAEAARVEHEMYVIARQLWSTLFQKQPLPPDDPDGRRTTVRTVLAKLGQEHSKPEELVKDAQRVVDELKTFIASHDILRLPDPDTCKLIEMPEFQRGNSTAYLNPAPPLDAKASSYYAISPPPSDWDDRRRASYLEEYNSHMLKILSIHEAYPGHYVQLEYSNRSPSLIRKVLSSGVFAEGWAVYTEQMMLDQGFGRRHEATGERRGGMGQGKEILALRLHQLKFYLRAVINAIIDYKMHCTNMTDDEVMDLLVKRGFQSEGEARLKVIRAKQSSCQLSTYFVGRMAFYRLRQQVQRELGEKFDLGRYHEAVLVHGTLPVKYLPELVRERLKQPR